MLAVIIVVNLRGALRKFTDVPHMWRVNRVDASIWLITMATSALVNTELGLLVGVLVSAFCVLGRTQRAQALELGHTGARELYEDLASYRGLRTQPGVAVFRYEAPIYYANQRLFKTSLYRRLGLDPVKEKARRRKLEKKQNKQEEVGAREATGARRTEERGVVGKEDETEVPVTKVLMPEKKGSGQFHSVVMDCSAVLFLDTAGVNALKEIHKDYKELGVKVLLAQCNHSVRDSLERGGYYPDSKEGEGVAGEREMVFFTITDAVRYAQSLSTPNGDCDTSC